MTVPSFDARNAFDRRATRQRRHDSQWGFQTISVVGGVALLLLLVVALMLPEGAILAVVNSAGLAQEATALPAAPESWQLQTEVTPEPQPAQQETTPATTTGGQESAQPAAPITTTEEVTASEGGTVAGATLSYACNGCIEGRIIDLYDQPAGANWTVTVTPVGGGAPVVVTADARGNFRVPAVPVPGLCPGKYKVELAVPDCWREVTPASFTVIVGANQTTCVKVRFKVQALPSLEVLKIDAHGGFGIPDWEITARKGTTIKVATTDGTGRAYFYCLDPGLWTVSEEMKIGWKAVVPPGAIQQIQLDSPRRPGNQKLIFKNIQVHFGGIHVRKLDAAGTPLRGWKITVVRKDGTQPPQVGYTDVNGDAWFKGLPLGEWVVKETGQAWYRPVGPAEYTVNLTVPDYEELVVFKNEPLGCVDGYKINDLGQGLAGWTITARDDFTGEELTAITDKTGYFQFMGLSLSTWTISEEQRAGWEPVTASEFKVEVKRPFVCERVRFKNRTRTACLNVYKKDSTDRAGIAGWEITVKPAFGGEPVVAETDGTGWVQFAGLAPGVYDVTETMQDGWVPDTPKTQRVTLVASGTCGAVTFWNHQKTAPPPKVDPPPVKPCCRIRYTVKCGDTLSNIAWRFGTTPNRLAWVNHLRNPNLIYIGQVLCIP